MREVVITDCVRTAIGTLNGSLSKYDEQELAAMIMQEALRRSRIQESDVDEVIFGHVKMNTYPMNVARHGWLTGAGSDAVPGFTLTRACSSSSQAIFDATQIIGCGDADVILAGGVESMSKSCYYLRGVRNGFGNQDVILHDNLIEGGPSNTPASIYGDLSMGITAENVAEQYQVDRLSQDEFALMSQQRANAAIINGEFKEQIMPVDGFDTDEFPRANSSMEGLAKLKPIFRKNGSVTAGNSSGRNDGASAAIVMSREKADELGYDFYLRHVASAVAAIDPSIMGVGPIFATKKALEKAKLSISDIGLIELNEAFASQSVAVMREWASWEESESFESVVARTNIQGGAISLGHPLAATGGMLTAKLFYQMKKNPDKRYGMVTMCIAGGMGFASIFEQCRRDDV